MKNNFKYFHNPLFFLLITLFSCQKELNFDSVQNPVVPAKFSLQGAPDICMTAVINGNYKKDSVLNKYNEVIISVNVSIVGSYKISTDTVNGYSFSVAGNFTNTGIQFVNLPERVSLWQYKLIHLK